ncbi:MAG TPA: Asd/ArgC dimerization domain-containing protein [Terriglobales bacterium]|nr:Asd/ArgC dimerization domain-containing protein [Terriglobales bacterium]
MSEKKQPVFRAAGWSGLQKVAIVGAASLKGKELKEVLDEKNFPAEDFRLLDDDDAQGQLDVVGDEPTFIQMVARDSFEKVDLTFFACEPEFTRKHWKLAQKGGCAIVDLSYGLEAEKTLRIRSPWIDRELHPNAETAAQLDLETTTVIAAHPAATVLALLMHRLQKSLALRATSATVFEPVSELGKRGMDELHQQTLNLLSFQLMPKEVYDMQIAFNMLSRYGEESKASLEAVEERITRHFQQITRSKVKMPAVQVLQAPTFHAHAISIFIETEQQNSVADVLSALQGDHVVIVSQDEDGPSNVTAAGQDEILVASRADKINAHGFWIWAAADNLKISALTALECAASLAAARPSGKIQ